jgi:hypothetical protein
MIQRDKFSNVEEEFLVSSILTVIDFCSRIQGYVEEFVCSAWVITLFEDDGG